MIAPYRAAEPLGPLVSSHPVSGVQQYVRIGVGVFCLLVALDAFALPFFMPRRDGPDWTLLLVSGAVGLIFAVMAGYALIAFLRARRQRVDVHEEGVRLWDGPRVRDLRWVDMASVGGLLWEPLGGGQPDGAALWIDDLQGERLALPSPVREPYALGREIRSHTFEARLAEAQRRIAAGERARFGRCQLDAEALVLGREIVSRRAIARAGLSSRWVEVRLERRGRRLLPTEQVPDADVLIALLGAADRLGGLASDRPS